MPCEPDLLQTHFEMSAPYPSLQTTIILKNPSVSDGEAITASVTSKRATDGTLYTYVKTKGGRKKLKWQFTISRAKCLELEGFVKAYFASQIRVVDHNGRIWLGYFLGNPFDFVGTGRAGPANSSWPAGEDYTFNVEFEGIEQ